MEHFSAHYYQFDQRYVKSTLFLRNISRLSMTRKQTGSCEKMKVSMLLSIISHPYQNLKLETIQSWQ